MASKNVFLGAVLVLLVALTALALFFSRPAGAQTGLFSSDGGTIHRAAPTGVPRTDGGTGRDGGGL